MWVRTKVTYDMNLKASQERKHSLDVLMFEFNFPKVLIQHIILPFLYQECEKCGFVLHEQFNFADHDECPGCPAGPCVTQYLYYKDAPDTNVKSWDYYGEFKRNGIELWGEYETLFFSMQLNWYFEPDLRRMYEKKDGLLLELVHRDDEIPYKPPHFVPGIFSEMWFANDQYCVRKKLIFNPNHKICDSFPSLKNNKKRKRNSEKDNFI